MGVILPDDILLLIGEQLQHRADRRNLIFVSRHFNELFLRFLYRLVRLDNWRATRSFLISISSRPYLDSIVRELGLGGWRPELISEAERDELQNCGIFDAQVELSSHSTEEIAQWWEDLSKGLGNAWIALMLPMLSHLRRLHLEYSIRSSYLERTMQRAFRCEKAFHHQPVFEHLREVSLHYRDDLDHADAGYNIFDRLGSSKSTILLSFFRLPSVRKIVFNSLVEPGSIEEEKQGSEKSPVGFSSITEIDLRASSGNQGMKPLITACANLESFKYQHSDAHALSYGYWPTAFHRSLSHSRKTLHTLWLDSYGEHHTYVVVGLNRSRDEWFGSLADFTVLRELRIRLPNLLDVRYHNEPSMSLVQCLPPSLETLFIEGCEERDMAMLTSQLQFVVKSRTSHMPHLRRLDIEGAFCDILSDELGEFRDSVLQTSNFCMKSKVMQSTESLHRDCATAGVELYLHDRRIDADMR